MSVLPKMITREAEKLHSSSDLPCVWGDVRIHLGYGFQSFWLFFFKLKFKLKTILNELILLSSGPT